MRVTNSTWLTMVAVSFSMILGVAANAVFSQSTPPGNYYVFCKNSGPGACDKSNQDCIDAGDRGCFKYQPPNSEYKRCRCER
jgi:hypothetical protein